MADEPKWFQPGYRLPTPRRTPGELLWSLRKDHERLTCELYNRGEALRFEVSTWRDGDSYHSHRFELRAQAEHYAAALRPTTRSISWAPRISAPTTTRPMPMPFCGKPAHQPQRRRHRAR